jgi:hypothetical protein
MSRSSVEFPLQQLIASPVEVTLPKSYFYCLLDEQPHYLVPERYPETEHESGLTEHLIVNPQCWFTWNGSPPSEVVGELSLPSQFATGTEMVWVSDPETRMLSPFWLGHAYTALLLGLRPGEPVPLSLPAHARLVLSFARVLVDHNYVAQRRTELASAVSYCAHLFKRGYVPLGRLIHPYHIAALRRYYRYLIRNGNFKLGDEQSPHRYVAENEPVARFFHHQLTHIVSDIVGEPIKPSYAFFASYQSGAELPRHTDREQCEYSITLCIDHSPEPKRESPWPLYLDTPEGTVTVFQGIGDSLLYRGRKLAHYRKKLPEGFTSTSIFFHYVSKNFSGPLQ